MQRVPSQMPRQESELFFQLLKANPSDFLPADYRRLRELQLDLLYRPLSGQEINEIKLILGIKEEAA